MILQNKQTGVLGVLEATTYHGGRPDNIVEVYEMGMGAVRVLAQYKTLEELLEEWGDYEPNVPLIEDEEVRECAKLWLEINGIYSVTYHKRRGGGSYLELDNMPMRNGCCIIFQDLIEGLKDGRVYTAAELCGEEEE